MPRYAHQRPVNRLYSYNYGYMKNYYKPLTHYLEKKGDSHLERTERAPSEQPGHQSLAERLKTFPMDGSIYRSRASSAPPARRFYDDDDEDFFPMPSKASKGWEPEDSSFTAPSSGRRSRARPRSTYEPSGLTSTYEPRGRAKVSDAEQRIIPLWMKHPYRLPVEDEVVPPHESSIWPESVPHFNLVSSYDAMVGYLGLKYPVSS